MSSELWTIRKIARHYNVDPKTAHRWTLQPWFPDPVTRAMRRGQATQYDPAAVRRAIRAYDRRRPLNPATGRRRNANG
jgi:hypothetical protein